MPLAFTVLGTPTASTTASPTYAHPAVTPTGSAAALFVCGSSATDVATIATLTSPSWLSGAWEHFRAQDTLNEINAYAGLTIATPAAAGATINFGAGDAQTGGAVTIIDITGANLSNVVVQTPKTVTGTGTSTGTQALTSPLADPANAVLAIVFTSMNETLSGTGKLAEVGYISPTRQLGVFAIVGDDEVSISWTTSGYWNLMLLEIAAASGAPAGSVTRDIVLVL